MCAAARARPNVSTRTAGRRARTAPRACTTAICLRRPWPTITDRVQRVTLLLIVLLATVFRPPEPAVLSRQDRRLLETLPDMSRPIQRSKSAFHSPHGRFSLPRVVRPRSMTRSLINSVTYSRLRVLSLSFVASSRIPHQTPLLVSPFSIPPPPPRTARLTGAPKFFVVSLSPVGLPAERPEFQNPSLESSLAGDQTRTLVMSTPTMPAWCHIIAATMSLLANVMTVG